MSRGLIHDKSIRKDMNFDEFLKRVMQIDVSEFDRKMDGTGWRIERKVRSKRAIKPKKQEV